MPLITVDLALDFGPSSSGKSVIIASTEGNRSVPGREAERAKQIVLGTAGISARDAIHLAVMERSGIESIMSFDSGLDQFPGITRIHR